MKKMLNEKILWNIDKQNWIPLNWVLFCWIHILQLNNRQLGISTIIHLALFQHFIIMDSAFCAKLAISSAATLWKQSSNTG